MIAASLTPLPLSNLRELCARRLPRPGRGVKNHPQPRHALSHSFTSPAPASREGLGVLAHTQDLAQPFSAQALTSYFAHPPGWVYPIFRHNRTNPPTVIPSVARISAPSRALCAMNLLLSLPHGSPDTGHGSPAANPIRIRTSAKHARNPIGMNSSKTQHLKLFRMNTYRKTRGGAPPPATIQRLWEIRSPDTIRHSLRRNLFPSGALLLHCLWLKIVRAG
jgi:hypothetical protein